VQYQDYPRPSASFFTPDAMASDSMR